MLIMSAQDYDIIKPDVGLVQLISIAIYDNVK